MKVTVRLSNETMQSIEKLKCYFEKDNRYSGLRLTNGNIVNNCFQLIDTKTDLEKVIKSEPIIFKEDNKLVKEIKTNLTLNEDTINKIEKLKIEMPKLTGTSYVTTPYIIRMVVRYYIHQNNIR